MSGAEKILKALRSGKIDKEQAKRLYQELQDKEAPIVDEMHPDIGFGSRFVYKNFGADKEKSFQYLQKKYPGLTFRKEESGGVLAKRPDEKEWRRLDPTGFDMQDITDLVWDVPAGALEGTAAVAGGLAAGTGGLVTGPGAIPIGLAGGAAAGAGTGVALEAARNQIGQWLGINQDQSKDDLMWAGGFGAISPLLLGTGAGGKAILKQAIKQVGKDAPKEVLEAAVKKIAKTQQGLLGQAKGKIAPWMGEKMSGIESRYLKRAYQDLDNMADPAKDFDAVDALEGVRSKILESGSQKMQDTGSQIGAILEANQKQVDLTPVHGEFSVLIKKYEQKAKAFGTDAAKEDLDFVKKAYKRYMPKKGKKLGGEDAVILKRDLNDLTGIKRQNKSGFDTQQFKKSEVEKDLERIAKKATSKLDETITAGIDDGGALKQLNRQYSDQIKNQQKLQKLFKDGETTQRTLKKSLGGKDAKFINKTLEQSGVDVENMAEGMAAADIFAKPDNKILSMGSSPTGRSLALQGAGVLGGGYVGGEMGGGQGAALGTGLGMFGALLGSPKALKAMMRAQKMSTRGVDAIQNAGPGILPYTPRIQSGVNIYEKMREDQ